MASFEDLVKLQELLKTSVKKHSGDDSLKSAVILIYNSSREVIFQVADNLMKGRVKDGEDVAFVSDAKRPSLPDKEIWDFHLGDVVAVKLSREDFKWMQKETIGWRENLNEEYGHIGVVTRINSNHDNSIGVYFPDVYTACSLYAGVLEKVERPVYKNLLSRWKVGDYVKTIPSKKVLRLLQRGLDTIPNELMEVKGRVVAVTHPSILVTFDNKRTYDFKSSSLVPCEDTTPIVEEEIDHARGFKIGEEVKLISNMKKLIENQKDFGGWSEDMSSICGKTGTVIFIMKDGSLGVQTKHFRSWRINPDSVLRSGEDEIVYDEDLKFHCGDVVKITVPQNIREILAMAEVPSVFLEFLRCTAVVTLIDDDLDYYTRFNVDKHIQTDEKLFQKVIKSERDKHDDVEKRVRELKVGDRVHLDIGPPNYVQGVIKDLQLDPVIASAMVKSAQLIGFITPYIALIEYEDGKRFRVKKKFLTVPEKYHVDESKDVISVEAIGLIYDAITKCVQDIHGRDKSGDKKWKVNAIFMSHGNPPCVEYKIVSALATFKAVLAWFDKHSGWDVERLCDGQFLLRGVESTNMEVKVGIIFNDETSTFDSKVDHGVVITSHSENDSTRNKAVPFGEGTRDPRTEEKPNIESFSQFSYIKLYNPSLAHDVFFPYVVHGQRRTPIQPVGPGVDNRQVQQNRVYHIQNIEVFDNAL